MSFRNFLATGEQSILLPLSPAAGLPEVRTAPKDLESALHPGAADAAIGGGVRIESDICAVRDQHIIVNALHMDGCAVAQLVFKIHLDGVARIGPYDKGPHPLIGREAGSSNRFRASLRIRSESCLSTYNIPLGS